MSLPSMAEVEHADWTGLKRMCTSLGLNPKGRSAVVRMRVLDHVRRRVRPEAWRPGPESSAALLTRLGFPNEAARMWESTIQLDAPAPWIGLGRSSLLAGDLQEAVKSFDRAAQMGYAVAHLHRAEALAAGGDVEGAAQACDAFLQARPGELRGLLLKASYLAHGGWTDEAAAIHRLAFDAHPHATGLWRGLGTILLRGTRAEPAAEAFREAVRTDPKDEESWINRGVALLLVGRRREAIGAFREVLESDPRQAVALNDLGVTYLRAGRMKSALVNLARAAKHLEIPSILLNVARAQEEARERAEALATYERVLRLKPRDAEALAGRKRLMLRRTRGLAAQKRRVRERKTAGPQVKHAVQKERTRPAKQRTRAARDRNQRSVKKAKHPRMRMKRRGKSTTR